jgi:hypothetical protein
MPGYDLSMLGKANGTTGGGYAAAQLSLSGFGSATKKRAAPKQQQKRGGFDLSLLDSSAPSMSSAPNFGNFGMASTKAAEAAAQREQKQQEREQAAHAKAAAKLAEAERRQQALAWRQQEQEQAAHAKAAAKSAEAQAKAQAKAAAAAAKAAEVTAKRQQKQSQSQQNRGGYDLSLLNFPSGSSGAGLAAAQLALSGHGAHPAPKPKPKQQQQKGSYDLSLLSRAPSASGGSNFRVAPPQQQQPRFVFDPALVQKAQQQCAQGYIGGLGTSATLDTGCKMMQLIRDKLQDTPVCSSVEQAVMALPGQLSSRLLLMLKAKRLDMVRKLNQHPQLRSYSVDFALAIWMWSLEDPAVFRCCNENGPARKEGKVTQAFNQCLPFMRYLDFALLQLPAGFRFSGLCHRGVQYVFPSSKDHNPEKHFRMNTAMHFFEFSAASTDASVMSSDAFCGHDIFTPRTVYDIHATEAFKISVFSEFGSEESEVLFRPLSKFEVIHAAKKCDPTCTIDPTGGFPDAVVLRQVSSSWSPPPPHHTAHSHGALAAPVQPAAVSNVPPQNLGAGAAGAAAAGAAGAAAAGAAVVAAAAAAAAPTQAEVDEAYAIATAGPQPPQPPPVALAPADHTVHEVCDDDVSEPSLPPSPPPAPSQKINDGSSSDAGVVLQLQELGFPREAACCALAAAAGNLERAVGILVAGHHHHHQVPAAVAAAAASAPASALAPSAPAVAAVPVNAVAAADEHVIRTCFMNEMNVS